MSRSNPNDAGGAAGNVEPMWVEPEDGNVNPMTVGGGMARKRGDQQRQEAASMLKGKYAR